MCGIVGFIDFTKKLSPDILKRMNQSVAHRGSDDSGVFFSNLHEANIGFGHQRLSILELSNLGHQPMQFENLTITFNGEIYNFSEIKVKLNELGYTFSSQSDTELILKAFHCWGISAIERFVGMFAIAIFDAQRNRVFLIRDRAGVKPINFYYKEGVFAFSSEIKSFFELPNFKKEIDSDSVGAYFKYGYIPTPFSIFKYIEKIKPGFILELNLSDKSIKEQAYWNVFDYYNKPKLNISLSEAENEIERLIIQSCKLRLISDVPVGIFLSGGYDSSLITAITQKEKTKKIKTFSIGFQESTYNESHHAKKIATHLETDHTEFIVNYKDAENEINNYPDIYDEPFNDTSGLLVSMISRLAVSKLKVVLTGDGAEEVFAGYENYLPGKMKYDYISKLPVFLKYSLDQTNDILLRREQNADSKLFSTLYTLKAIFGTPLVIGNRPLIFRDNFLKSNFELKPNFFFETHNLNSNNDIYNRLLAIDYKTRLLDDFLNKIDKATMYHGLEAREPLLDHRIIEFTAQLPCQLKCYKNTPKYLLKSITHKYLPENMMNRPKMGFALPIEKWLRGDLKEIFLDNVNKSSLKHSSLFNIDNVITQRQKFLSNNLDYNSSKRIVSIFLFQLWYKKWML